MSQSSPTGSGALIPNPALKPLQFLVGEWRTTGTHPQMPGETLFGRTSLSWHEGGAFLIIRSEVHHPLIPDGVAIIGSDDGAGRFAMTYFDERGVSRLFDVSIGVRSLRWRRDDPLLSQSMTISADESGERLVGNGRMSENGGDWVDDLSLVYTRRTQPGAER